jgi:hypothetical protein
MGDPKQSTESSPFRFSLAWLLAYVATMALVCAGLAYGRANLLAAYGSEEAFSDWNMWRFEVAVEQGMGKPSVQRRIPKSEEPPALVLMRDYFPACLGLALLLSTVLFGTFAFFVRGALQHTAARPLNPEL